MVKWFVTKHSHIWATLARRNSTEWARFDDDVDYDAGETMKTKYDPKRENNPNRYRAVNFNNEHTVEFRLFRGTLKYSTFIATLELVDALVRFIKNFKVGPVLKEHKTTWQQYLEYIATEPGLYKEAIEYMKSKNVWTLKEE